MSGSDATATPLAEEISAATNGLLDQSGLPKFSRITPADVKPAITHLIGKQKAQFAELELKAPTVAPAQVYREVVQALQLIATPLEWAWGLVDHLMLVKNSDALRAAHEEMQPLIVEAQQQIGQSRPLYEALQRLRETSDAWDALQEPQQRIVEAKLREMRHAGVGLEGEARETFNRLLLELAELSTKFGNNVIDSTKEFSLLLTRPEEVKGLPPSALSLAAQSAVAKGHEGATADQGPWLISLNAPSYLPFMQYAENRELREKLFRAFVTVASSGDKDNAPIILRTLQAKQQRARLLGYQTHAEYSLASKMASSVEEVGTLQTLLRDASYEPAKQELAAVQAFAQEHGFQGELALWDVPFWAERRKEALYAFTEEELRPYFALPNVLEGLFQLCTRLFNVQIIAADGEAEVWHPDVRFFRVVENGKPISCFFIDPYVRPGEKQNGAWCLNILNSSQLLNRQPVLGIVCNGTPPIGDVPSLMTFRDVETLFHETGHALHGMLTLVSHGEASNEAANVMEWDAVELPSQFMENWCYDRPTLYGFAKHHATGEPLPEELYTKLKAQKNYNAGMAILRQLYFGKVDMELHHSYDPTDASATTPNEVMHAIARHYTVLPPLPEDRFLCSFKHIFSGGYSAGYYSYFWAEVMSADAFAAFEEVGLDNEEAVKEVGKRYRDTVLAYGGGKHPRDVFREFRGRDPAPQALLRHRGVAK